MNESQVPPHQSSGVGPTGSAHPVHPNVVWGEDGRFNPAPGYVWVDRDSQDDYRVMPLESEPSIQERSDSRAGLGVWIGAGISFFLGRELASYTVFVGAQRANESASAEQLKHFADLGMTLHMEALTRSMEHAPDAAIAGAIIGFLFTLGVALESRRPGICWYAPLVGGAVGSFAAAILGYCWGVYRW